MNDQFALVRIDFRLIHGQVITKWMKKTGARKIWVINDAIASDPFLGDIYKMAAPPNVEINILKLAEVPEKIEEAKGKLSQILVLFKTVSDTFQCVKQGVSIPDLQIGGLGSGEGRINVYGPITLDNTDASMLNELQEKHGVNVVFHQVPDESAATLSKILAKYDFDLT